MFKGTAVSAKLINAEDADSDEYIPFVEVRWKVDEVFKGEKLDGGSAITQYLCGGVFIKVGQPYVFALGPVEELFYKLGPLPNLLGYLDDQGTKGEWESEQEFNTLVTEFRKLGRGKL